MKVIRRRSILQTSGISFVREAEQIGGNVQLNWGKLKTQKLLLCLHVQRRINQELLFPRGDNYFSFGYKSSRSVRWLIRDLFLDTAKGHLPGPGFGGI